jgi:hypothetical protein
MSPSLYNWYSRPEIDRLAGGLAKPVACCNYYVRTPKQLFCLASVDSDKKDYYLSTPSTLTWHPRFDSPENSTFLGKGKLPIELDEALHQQACQKLLFVAKDNCNYMYIGDISLFFVGLDENRDRIVRFHIKPKLSREAWSLFGSYTDWLLTVNGQLRNISSLPDLQTILTQSQNLQIVDIWLTRYEEDQLHLVVNGEYGYVKYLNEEEDLALLSRNPRIQRSGDEIFSFAGFGGSDWDVEERAVVSKSEAFHILTVFFQKGTAEGLLGTG